MNCKRECGGSDGSEMFNCRNCEVKPAITEVKRICKIYINYRLAELNSKDSLYFGEYWRFIMTDHLSKVVEFKTLEEINNDIINHTGTQNKTFMGWYKEQIDENINIDLSREVVK